MTQEHSTRVPRREHQLHGLLLVDKPGLQQLVDPAYPYTPHSGRKEQHVPSDTVTAGGAALPRLYTSHDIVQLVRRWSGQRRIGHTGTLDPMASGLMVLCLGQATRLVEYYQGHDKTYLAEITLGQATDSYDAVGQPSTTAPIPPLDESILEQALQKFQGDIQQVPPIYSALKQGGESLHRKARRGEEITVTARPVTIHRIALLNFDAPARLTLRVTCSAGTYIRSLAHDLGKVLGTYGHLSMLRRETIGEFQIDDALTLHAIEAAAVADDFEAHLVPAGTALGFPEIRLTDEWAKRLGYGQKVPLPPAVIAPVTHATTATIGRPDEAKILAKAIDENGNFLGVIQCLQDATSSDTPSIWKAAKWLASE